MTKGFGLIEFDNDQKSGKTYPLCIGARRFTVIFLNCLVTFLRVY